jgi:hypothetical protein
MFRIHNTVAKKTTNKTVTAIAERFNRVGIYRQKIFCEIQYRYILYNFRRVYCIFQLVDFLNFFHGIRSP